MKIKYSFFLFIVINILFSPIILNAQERDPKQLKHEKRHKLANNLITTGSYYSAIDHLNDLAKQHPKEEKYSMRLADAYFLSRDYKNAEIWYGKLANTQKKTTVALYRYAQCLKYNAKYQEAQDAFKKYASAKQQDNLATKLKNFAKNEIMSCEWAMKNTDTSDLFDVNHIGDHVNSKYSEFGPVLMNDSTLVFSSLQSDSVIVVGADEAHTKHVKLLASTWNNMEWGPHTELQNVNTTYENNANGTFSSDGKRFYFTRCKPNDQNEVVCAIYMSEIVNGEFQKPVKLDDKVNVNGFTCTQPNIGEINITNKTYEVLFYSSNRPGGKGGMDIWYCTVNQDGSLKTSANAGNVINTIGDEITPFLHSESGILYFSSNFHFGYGGYDVFKSTGALNKWNKPINLGKPVNTRVDDTYYTIDNSWRNGFVVSNRPEGYHLTSETCCDDIYSVDIEIPVALTAEAYSVKDTSLAVDAKFIVFEKNKEILPALFDNANSASDSLLAMMKSQSHSIIYNYFQNISSKNTPSDSSINIQNYREIQSEKKYYRLTPQKDYVVFGIGKFDTSSFVFRVASQSHKLDGSSSSDSLTQNHFKGGKMIDIIKVKFYLDADSLKPVPIAMEKTVEKIDTLVEDEKTLTVTRFLNELKEKRNRDLKIILNYDFDDEQFIKTHTPSLDSLADLMKAYPDLKINIAAHTDDKGTEQYNIDLSKRRAKSIVSFLVHKGIDKNRMFSFWYGETQPMVPNSNPDGSDNPYNRHLNRRAEITIAEGQLE